MRILQPIKNKMQNFTKELRKHGTKSDLSLEERCILTHCEKIDKDSEYQTPSSSPSHKRQRRSCRPATPITLDSYRDRSESPPPNTLYNYHEGSLANYDRKKSITPTNDNVNEIEHDPNWDPQIIEDVIEVYPFVMGSLENIGNTCYMNAVLYILRFTPTFLHNLHHLLHNVLIFCDDIELPIDATTNMCSQLMATSQMTANLDNWPFEIAINAENRWILFHFHRIFSNMTAEEKKEQGAAIKAYELQKQIYDANNTFRPFTQQDSHEFLMEILNRFRDISDECMDLIQSQPGFFDDISDPASMLSFNFFRENLMGKRETMIRCEFCESKHRNSEDIIDLIVTLPPGNKMDDDFIRRSSITEERLKDKIQCTTCDRPTDSIQFTTYPKLPRILIVHLRRFDNHMNKVRTASPTPFQLQCFCTACPVNNRDEHAADHEYHLYGVIVHVGESLKSGHYISYVRKFNRNPQPQFPCKYQSNCCGINLKTMDGDRHIDQTADDTWFICDDDKITPISQPDLQAKIQSDQTRTPYILFYVRNDLLAKYLA